MPIDEAGLSAALDSGIAAASGAPPPAATPAAAPATTTPPTDGGTPDAATVDTSAQPSGSESGDEGGEAAPAAAVQPGDEPPAGDAAPGDGGEGDGTGADAEGAAPTEGDPAKPAEEPAKPDAKEPDPLNDPLPNALKKETKERFHKVVGMVKERDERIGRLERDLETVMVPVEQSRATPVQFKQAFEYLSMVNSDSLEDKERALGFLLKEVRSLAVMVGKPVPGVNFLEGHDDLIQDVGSGRLAPQRAMEIAIGREQQARARTVLNERAQQNQQTEQSRQTIAAAKNELNAVEKRLSTEPGYARKREILVRSLRPVFSQIHPSQWAATFERAYRELPDITPPTPTPTPVRAAGATGTPAPTPLRAAQPAGQALPAPKSSFDAVEQALSTPRR